MSNVVKVWLGIAAGFVTVGLIVFVVVMTISGWDFSIFETNKYETNTFELDEEFNSLLIDTSVADVECIPSEDGKCKVVCYESAYAKHSGRY